MKMKSIKEDFPIFVHHPDLVYLDSTATALKPRSVIAKLIEYYEQYSANVFRGVYGLSERATSEHEETRAVVSQFIHSDRADEIIFTRNTTESINLIAYGLGRKILGEGDEMIVTVMEHHSNFVPWQVLAGEVGAIFKVIDIDENGYLDLSTKLDLEGIVTKKTKILALTYVSNVLGTINPVKNIIAAAKKINPDIITIVDAAQAVSRLNVDVKQLGCDFLAFSSHKIMGPTGVGILWGKHSILQEMYPFNFGGEMIKEVHLDKTIFEEAPHKFEAGTPSIGEVIALKEAIKYILSIGIEYIKKHEEKLLAYAIGRLEETFKKRIRILGPKKLDDRVGIVAFTLQHIHPHDIAQILDDHHICIRAGHHCAMPLHERLAMNATARASFYVYNDTEDVDRLIDALKKTEEILK